MSYSELAPYYEIAERTMQITADPVDVPNLPAGYCDYRHRVPEDWQALGRSALKRGQGFTTMPLADGPPHLLLRRGTAFNSFSLLLERLHKQKKFELITGAHVLNLEWDGAKKKVVAAVYHDSASNTPKADFGECVRGRLRTTQFAETALQLGLQRSSDSGLGNSTGLLGQYLHDHPREWWAVDVDAPITSLSPAGISHAPATRHIAPSSRLLLDHRCVRHDR